MRGGPSADDMQGGGGWCTRGGGRRKTRLQEGGKNGHVGGMKTLLPLLGLVAACVARSGAAENTAPREFKGRIERLDPAFDQLVAVDAQLEKMAEGFTWSEGPVWFQGALLFSDVPKNVIYRWKSGATAASAARSRFQ